MPRKKKDLDNKPQVAIIKERAKKRPDKKSLLDMQQADGKLYNKHNVRSIDELIGVKSGKYHTQDVVAYEKYLNDLNVSDLQKHASSVQVMPNQDRRVMINRLLKEFRIHNSSFLNSAQPISAPMKPVSQEVIDILSEGR